jgi:signal transduction histidine kinase
MRSLLRALNAQSVASRLFLSAAFWSATILVLAGLGLSALDARSAESSFDGELNVYLKALVANVAISEETHATNAPVIAPQFELPFSGWYWQITRLDHDPPEIRTSRSLFGSQLAKFGEESGGRDVVSGYLAGPGDKPLRMLQRTIDAGDDGRFLVQVAANAEVIQTQIARFEYALAATFFLLAVALIGSTALAVRFGLRPLRELRDGVASIRRGETERIAGSFPEDVAPLAEEINLLLDSNRVVVERARTQVGNLAHALKTPLSVIVNEAEAQSPMLAEKVQEQAVLMTRQVSFYLERARAAARASSLSASTDVKPVVEGLVRTFEKVYRERDLAFEIGRIDGLRFRGESQDLADLIGNLLDNAGKWAHAQVRVSAEREPDPHAALRAYFIARIDDDGPGLDREARQAAIERGRRLDESRPGSGLGLSIVVDLAAAYGGALTLEDSPLGGLRASLRLPCF